MIVPDVNLLVYAYNSTSPHHEAAKAWWDDLIAGSEEVALPWVVVTGFIRMMANPSVVSPPVPPVVSVAHIRHWFQHPHINPINPGNDHLDWLDGNFEFAGIGRNMVADTHIASIAMEHDAEVHSRDSDFSRFPGLKWHDPLQ